MHDETVVEHLDPDRQLMLTARGRPLGEARVVLDWLRNTPAPGSRCTRGLPLGQAGG